MVLRVCLCVCNCGTVLLVSSLYLISTVFLFLSTYVPSPIFGTSSLDLPLRCFIFVVTYKIVFIKFSHLMISDKFYLYFLFFFLYSYISLFFNSTSGKCSNTRSNLFDHYYDSRRNK